MRVPSRAEEEAEDAEEAEKWANARDDAGDGETAGETMERHRVLWQGELAQRRAALLRHRELYTRDPTVSVDVMLLAQRREGDARKFRALARSAQSATPGVHDSLAPWRRNAHPVTNHRNLKWRRTHVYHHEQRGDGATRTRTSTSRRSTEPGLT